MKARTLLELTKDLDVVIKGDPSCVIKGVAPIQVAKAGDIAFLSNPLYRKYLSDTQSSAVILAEADLPFCSVNAVVSKNPYFAYAKIAEFFAIKSKTAMSIHSTAVIGEACDIDKTVTVSAHAVIGQRVVLKKNVIIGPGVVIGDDCIIDEATILDANVVLYRGVHIGKRAHLASGVIVGADGFGIAKHEAAWHKVPQLGAVILGNDVEIGANTTIDRGALEDTVIGHGVKLDNLIQVGHNVKIGDHTVIAGCVAIAGSTEIGKHCMVGGGTRFNGHIKVCDHVVITGMTAVTKSIEKPGVYSSGIVGAVPNLEFRKNNARFHRLENLFVKVKQLETELECLKESDKNE